MGWTSGFLEITETSRANAPDMRYSYIRGLLKNNVDFCSQMVPDTRIA